MNTSILESSEYIERMKMLRSLSVRYEKSAEQQLITPDSHESQQILQYSDMLLNALSYKIAESETSLYEFKLRNQRVLNAGRKLIYEVLIRLEGLVSNLIDVPLSDLLVYQKKIEAVDDTMRSSLIRKLFIALDHIKIAYGDNTKWKWTFTELVGRASVISKNLLHLKRISAGLWPEQPGYKECRVHLKLVIEKLQFAAGEYRSKYELAGKQLIDMQFAMKLLNATRQLAMLTADRELADELKRKLSVWKQKLEFEVKRK